MNEIDKFYTEQVDLMMDSMEKVKVFAVETVETRLKASNDQIDKQFNRVQGSITKVHEDLT